jgi:pentatricopeptide repeat domain-containing protein 1
LEEYKDNTTDFSDVVAYTAAITGCEYAGQWKEALYLLDKMRKDGVQPNEVTVAAVLGACATACAKYSNSKRPNEIPEPHKKAMQLLQIVKSHPEFVKPNIQVYNAAIRVCAEAHDLQQAFALLQEIEDANIERTLITYGSLMTACERVGGVESASKVFRKLKDDGFVPNEIIYGAAISCCRKAKQSERAVLLLKKMVKEGLSPNAATFNTVMIAQAEGKSRADMERAILVYKLMKSKFATEDGRPNRQTYNIIINFFASMRQPVTAEAFLTKMRNDGFTPDVNLFTATVAAFERTGQPLRALRLMESMHEDGYDFYGVAVLNQAFKKALNLANKVGQTFTSKEDLDTKNEKFVMLVDQEDDDELIARK